MFLILHHFEKRHDKKLSVLARTKHYLTPDQKILLLNSVVKSQFSYCLLIGMITSIYLNNTLNSIHERALRLIYNDYELPFDRILEDTSLIPPIMSHLLSTGKTIIILEILKHDSLPTKEQ